MAEEYEGDENKEKDAGVYGEEEREELVDDEEMSPEEAGFMQGYDKAEEEEKDKDKEEAKEEEGNEEE